MHIVQIEKSILPFLKYKYLHSFLLQKEGKGIIPDKLILFTIAGAGDMHVHLWAALLGWLP